MDIGSRGWRFCDSRYQEGEISRRKPRRRKRNAQYVHALDKEYRTNTNAADEEMKAIEEIVERITAVGERYVLFHL